MWLKAFFISIILLGIMLNSECGYAVPDILNLSLDRNIATSSEGPVTVTVKIDKPIITFTPTETTLTLFIRSGCAHFPNGGKIHEIPIGKINEDIEKKFRVFLDNQSDAEKQEIAIEAKLMYKRIFPTGQIDVEPQTESKKVSFLAIYTSGWQRVKQLENQIEKLQKDLTKIKQENTKLREENDSLKDNYKVKYFWPAIIVLLLIIFFK